EDDVLLFLPENKQMSISEIKPDNETIQKIQNSDIFFSRGLRFETWAIDLASTQSKNNYIFCDLSNLNKQDVPSDSDKTSNKGILNNKKSGIDSSDFLIKKRNQNLIQAPSTFDPFLMKEVAIPQNEYKKNPYYSDQDFINDPYYYFSPTFSSSIFTEISNNLAALNPEKSDKYFQNATNLKHKIDQLYLNYREKIFNYRFINIITIDNELSLLVNSFGLININIPSELIEKNDINTIKNILKDERHKLLIYSDKKYKLFFEKHSALLNTDLYLFDTQINPDSKDKSNFTNLLQANLDMVLNALTKRYNK
ncbi:zinc ABC transporter substrate-binding protein, partial [Candidatus Gracilibacteria bacterium]|nr:zinc ABC transporter substrate-binding protein [Candidatus Gracilibacteria bacterium]